ncbi:hypothetical protein EV193_109201 [Herbihabitans rhizosphaerae]|uniref:Uncharacterized protein n=1 Tax=Herbihabitans rhizosphaerae TaxID=1872711 RepID=A0A4Q7KHL8_9PSEU|nr:hypothetical protein [Herbihabitans rhizosphaerae]RZS34410.1 hypothetical protein EV193_109201 [Herbihabitans rhizosphaerae]
MPNQIRFEVLTFETTPEVVPHVDSRPLTELIDAYEVGAKMDVAGDAYAGLVPAHFDFGPMEEHYLGAGMGPRVPLLGCTCGEWGCWPLMATVTAVGDTVTWDEFEQPHRTDRDYTGFGPFTFSRTDYDEALAVLMIDLADWA